MEAVNGKVKDCSKLSSLFPLASQSKETQDLTASEPVMTEETKQPQHQYIWRGVRDNAASSVTDQSTVRGMDVEGDTRMAKY